MLLHHKLIEYDVISYMHTYVINRSCLLITCSLALFHTSKAKSIALLVSEPQA